MKKSLNKIFIVSYKDLPTRYIQAWTGKLLVENFFTSKLWFDIFYSAVVTDQQKALCVCLELPDETPALILPILEDKLTHYLSMRKIRSLSNYYSGIFSPIYLLESDKFDRRQGLTDIASFICNNFKWDTLDILPLDISNTSFNYIKEAFSSNATKVTPYFSNANWYQATHNISYSEYLASRPSRHRNTIKRKTRKAKKEFGLTLTTQSDYTLEDATLIFNEIYYKRWGKNEPFPEFISTLFSKLDELGFLRLGILKFDNKPVAVQAWIVFNRTASIFKLAHLTEYALYSPGTILTSMMFENVLTLDKVSTIDFLTGDDNYKSLWMDNRKELWGIQVTNNKTLLGKVANLRNHISNNLK